MFSISKKRIKDSFIFVLKCTKCGKEVKNDGKHEKCPSCGGNLDVF
jgi:rRNA maturation endonuclease Nob1